MDEEKKKRLKRILDEARKSQKGNYNIYNYYSGRIFDLGLTHTEGTQALRRLANILRV